MTTHRTDAVPPAMNTTPSPPPPPAANPEGESHSRLRWQWPILAILAAFLLLGVFYSVANPLFESPDEVWHYEYVRWLAEGKGLPRPEEVGTAPWHQEGSQPPLYYLLTAVLTAPIPTDNADEVIRYNPHAAIGQAEAFGNKNMIVHGRADAWPWRGVALAAHVARLFSLLLGAVTVLATYGAALAIFPRQRDLAALASALVAFNPQFLFLSAAVNNDNLVIAASAAGVWLSVYLLGRPSLSKTRYLVLLGALVGVAAMSKLSGLALAGVAGLTLLILAWRARSFWSLIRWGLIVGVVALAVGGWWYLRNLYLYGDPLGLQAMFDILPRRPRPPTPAELLARTQGVWRSAWAVFGWFNVTADPWLYSIYTILSLAGALGLIVVWPLRYWRQKRGGDGSVLTPVSATQLVILVIWLLVMFAALVSWAQMRYPQGRLLFPALSAAAVLLSIGLLNWLPGRWRNIEATILTVALLGLAAIAPVRWITPAYTAPEALPATAIVPNALEATFGEQIQLVGYSIEQPQIKPGGKLQLTLYWRALQDPARDFSVFVHLIDDNGIVQAQRDSYPGAGTLPTGDWSPGVLYVDEHVIDLPDILPAPARFKINVGLYDTETGQRLPVGDADHWTLGYVSSAPRPSDSGLPNPVRINFDDQIALVGFQFDRQVMQPGDDLTIDLWWEALDQPKMDYVVFTHLVFPPDAVWAGMDAQPRQGAAPTSGWQPGQIIPDQHHLQLPADAPAGVYFVEIGIYDPDTFNRLPVNFSDKGIVLGQIRVEGGE